MRANDYQKAAMRTVGTSDKTELLIDGVLGLCGETGEVADLVKKATFQGHELNRAKVAEELGDVAWYLAVTAQAIGYNLDLIFKLNILKLRKRYPDGFDAERSIHRPEYEGGQTDD